MLGRDEGKDNPVPKELSESQKSVGEKKKDERPASALFRFIDGMFINYMSCALKFDRANDDLDAVRTELAKLKSALRLAAPLLEAYQDNTSKPFVPDLPRSRHLSALTRVKNAEQALTELTTAHQTKLFPLQAREAELSERIAVLEESPLVKAFRLNKATLRRMHAEKNRLEKRCEEPKGLMARLKQAIPSENEERDKAYVQVQLREIIKTIAKVEEQLKGFDEEELAQISAERTEIKKIILAEEEAFAKRVRGVRAEFADAEANLFIKQVEIAKIEFAFNSNISNEFMFACLLVYMRVCNLHATILQTYKEVTENKKTYRHDSRLTYVDPYTRITVLQAAVAGNQEKLDAFMGVLHCENSANKSGLELFDGLVLLPEAVRKRFSEAEKIELELLNNVIPVDVSRKPSLQSISVVFFTKPEETKTSLNAVSQPKTTRMFN